VADAAIAVGQGIPANSAYTAESDQYYVYGELLRRLGAAVSVGEPRSFLGVTCNLGDDDSSSYIL